MSTILIIFSMIFVFGPIAKAVADRINRDAAAVDPASALEMARLREEVERLGNEVARLQEEQSFMVQLLGEGEKKRLAEAPRSQT